MVHHINSSPVFIHTRRHRSRRPALGGREKNSTTIPQRSQGDLRATNRQDPPTRPSWRDRQYRELKKSLFSPPSKCTIDLFGPLSNRMIFKQLHVAIHFVASVLRRHGMGTTIHSLSTVTYLVLVLPPWLGHSSYHRSTPPPVACQRSAAAGGTQVVVDS